MKQPTSKRKKAAPKAHAKARTAEKAPASAASQQAVTGLARVAAAIAAIKPEQIVAPELGRDGSVDHLAPIGVANDHLKRLFTLANIEEAAADQLREKFHTVSNSIGHVMHGSRSSELKQIETDYYNKARYAAFLRELFWFEARQQIPTLKDSNDIGIRSDWSFIATDGDDLLSMLERASVGSIGSQPAKPNGRKQDNRVPPELAGLLLAGVLGAALQGRVSRRATGRHPFED